MTELDELERIRRHYATRKQTYSPLDPWVARTKLERERRIRCLIFRHFGKDVDQRKLLEIGCGNGDNLLMFLRLGFEPENLSGIELQEDRVARARYRLPVRITLKWQDAQRLDLPGHSQDIVFQSLVFSSILDDEVAQNVAEQMWRVLRPGGVIIWYDLAINNPRNDQVRGISKGRVRELFPNAKCRLRRITLAPPISRRLPERAGWLHSLIGGLPFLRTHYLGIVNKSA